ncbi:MAG: NAD(P)/FAD-dependent oxidoreductase [Halioglobus sp.]
MIDWQAPLSAASDEQITDALNSANIPALMAALMHLNGNRDHFAQVQPEFVMFAEDEDGLTEPDRQLARKLAFAALTKYRDSGYPTLTEPSEEDVTAAMNYITGTAIMPEQVPFLREELNLYAQDTRQVAIDTSTMADDFKVLIIGTGMSGILAAIRLQQQGIPFLMLEKNAEMTGTWYENTYPGCQVDSANHLYNYIFEPNLEWSGHFSGSAELNAYFNHVIDKYELRQHVRLNSPVHSATFNETDKRWVVEIESDGARKTLTADTVISAVGQLNSPKMPDIEGLDSFAGISFHSARWEHKHQLEGKRVIVIGTGCSAAQFVPKIAPQCGDLKVFQRSAPWLLPTETYHQPMTPEELWLFQEVPFYARWYRFFLFRTLAVDGLLPLMFSEPDWQGPPGTIGEGNEMLREAMIESLAEQAGDDKALLAKLIPDYPPGGKRPVLDDGSWISALTRNNVQLLTQSIAKVVPEGVLTADGTLHAADVIIYGTGFKADQFLIPMQVIGRNGVDLVSHWGGNPKAYKGMVIPDFPNFYCLYGPNSNIVVGASIVFMVECQMRYVMGCLKLQLENSLHTIECRKDVMDAYNQRIDALNSQRAWGAPAVSSWYKNSAGRVTQNWPGTHGEWWQQTLAPDPNDFLLS